MKLIKIIKGFKFKIEFDKIKDKFILNSPTTNNLEFKNLDDLKTFIKASYPRFVVRSVTELLRGIKYGE